MNQYGINSDLHELKQHGESLFPYQVYHGNIPAFQFSYPHHWHEEMEIIYVISGVGIATVNYNSYELHTCDILIISPNDVHSLSQYKNESWEYFNILFKLSLLEDSLSNLAYYHYFKPLSDHSKKLPIYISARTSLSQALSPDIQILLDNRKCNLTDCYLLIKAKLFSILYTLQPYLKQEHFEKENELFDSKIKVALLYIHNHYSSSITIHDIAKICCYSDSYFMKFFKKQMGISFIQYLNNYRLDTATKLLISNNDTITDIAISVGFDNIPYFVRSFHKKYGISPRDFRIKSSR